MTKLEAAIRLEDQWRADHPEFLGFARTYVAARLPDWEAQRRFFEDYVWSKQGAYP